MTKMTAYRNFWHPLALSTEVGGKPARFMLLGENLVAYRTQFGITVLKDLCIHRGCALSIGRVLDDGTLECPYHGWRYDHAGQCVRIPALPPGQPIPSKARAISYQVREQNDIVWVALGEPLAPFPDYLPDADYATPGTRSLIVDVYDWNVGAGRAVENFLDLAHFPFVHDSWLGDRADTQIEPYDVESTEYRLDFSYLQLQPGDLTTDSSEKLALRYTYLAPFTGHIRRSTPRTGEWTCVSLFAAPIDEKRTRAYVTFVRSFDTDPGSDAQYLSFVDTVIKQDAAILETVRPEEIPTDLREELHIRVPDIAGMVFRRILSDIEGRISVSGSSS
ncbi:aromatic ring-hydroxylating dioxygenase subunit alpha [Pseudomonas sessilinigenes]|uniref:Aromatic ring-hydroxylating dioxygenase subunit alpha n=1 Tax=Pseudomonas sessilinigenes TaxID=658629 RepID=A0ABX8MY09_9PSED|nr:aromatic ring-hydroxylating dioxygenase subunit alpha [Pseudomonas sessilinigenes]AZC24324.1 hypothetical protein C4K39_2650 [Pseudomonas sessilinigenes]QXH43273.1 aromatic ring-hydroxylating dioxygenase subunit alpha [Pseudomonas sessilinigenes]